MSTRREQRRSWAAWLWGVLAALAALRSRDARASDLGEVAVLVPVEVSRTWLSAPALALNGIRVSPRLLGLPVGSDSTFYGVSVGLRIDLFNDAATPAQSPFGLSMDVLRVRLAWSGSRGAEAEPADGGQVSVARSEEIILELSSPLLQYGAFYTSGNLRLGADLEWGWAYLWSQAGTVDTTGASATGSLTAGSPFVHLAASGCLLSRPLNVKKGLLRTGEGICVTVTPTLYEWGWLSGVSVGFRVDL